LKFHKYPPSPALQSTVKYFWTLQSDLKDVPGSTYRLVPDGYIEWIFHLEEPWEFSFLQNQTTETRFRSHLFGQAKNYIDLKLPNGKLFLFAVKFHPWAARQFLNLDMKHLTDREIAFSDIADRKLLELKSKIYEAPTISSKINLVENYLIKQSSMPKKTPLSVIVQDLKNHTTSLKSVSYSISQRRLEQRFQQEIGISPKLFQRIHKFNRVLEALIPRPKQSLTQLAYHFDYFDQSHFIRDFKRFTGKAPTQFLKNIQPSGDIWNLKIV